MVNPPAEALLEDQVIREAVEVLEHHLRTVRDLFLPARPARSGHGRGGVEKTTAEADLASDVASLGCVYLGGFTFAQLERSIRVKELRAGAIARADSMFRSDRAPWCPELF